MWLASSILDSQPRKCGVPTLGWGGVPPSSGVQVSQGLIHKWGKNGTRDRQVYLGGVHSDAVALLVRSAKREMSCKAKLSIYHSAVFQPSPTVRSWALGNERIRSWVQEAEISFWSTEELVEVAEEKSVCLSPCWNCCPHDPYPDKTRWDGLIYSFSFHLWELAFSGWTCPTALLSAAHNEG